MQLFAHKFLIFSLIQIVVLSLFTGCVSLPPTEPLSISAIELDPLVEMKTPEKGSAVLFVGESLLRELMDPHVNFQSLSESHAAYISLYDALGEALSAQYSTPSLSSQLPFFVELPKNKFPRTYGESFEGIAQNGVDLAKNQEVQHLFLLLEKFIGYRAATFIDFPYQERTGYWYPLQFEFDVIHYIRPFNASESESVSFETRHLGTFTGTITPKKKFLGYDPVVESEEAEGLFFSPGKPLEEDLPLVEPLNSEQALQLANAILIHLRLLPDEP